MVVPDWSGADLARLVTTLRDTPPDTEVPHWAAVQQVAASWRRRTGGARAGRRT